MYISTFTQKYTRNTQQFDLKMECDQPSGSFKMRGVHNLMSRKIKEGYVRFVSSSGGNAGYSAAFIAQQLKVKILVILPRTTAKKVVDGVKTLGAEIEIYGRDWQEADQKAREICTKVNACYIHPFDDPLLWEGHSTMIDEYAANHIKPDAIALSVGGGGLLTGVLLGMNRYGWDVPIIACETEGAESLAASIQAKKLVTLEQISSIATKDVVVIPHVVTDDLAIEARDWFKQEFNKEVEPACGAALDVVKKNRFLMYERILVVVCGGIGWTSDMSREYWQKPY